MKRLAAIAALAVMGIAGASAAVLVSTGDSAVDSYATCEKAVTELLLANRIVAPSQSYRKDNPTEYTKVRAYLDGGARPTGSLTHMGTGLVALEDTCRALAPVTTTTTATTTTTTTSPPAPAALYISPSGSDANACSQASPCQTFNRAYQAANCGDLVSIGSGSYGDQTIVEKAALNSCTTPVAMQANGAVTIAGGIDLGSCGSGCYASNGPQNLTLKGFSYTGDIFMQSDVRNITVDSVDGGGIYVSGDTNITVRNSDFGPCNSPSGPAPHCSRVMIRNCSGTSTSCGLVTGPNSNILFENNTIHDYVCSNCGNPDHWECVFFDGGQNVTFRSNRFYNCELYDIAMGENPGSTIDGVTIENNWFGVTCNWANGQGGCAQGQYRNSAIESGGASRIDNVLIRFNSFASGQVYVKEGNNTFLNWRLIGNILGGSNCEAGWAGVFYDYNLLKGGTCGSHSLNISSMPYVNGSGDSAMDYHLVAGSPAEAFVVATGADYDLALDYDRQPRMAPREAGSDER